MFFRNTDQTDLSSRSLERLQHEADMLVQIDPQLTGSQGDILTAHPFGETALLPLFLYRADGHVQNAPTRSHQSHSGDESAQFIDGEESLIQRALPFQFQVLGVGEDGVDDLLRITS